MAVAALAALVLAFVGVAGLSESKEILRSVYSIRMGSVQQLAEIDRLMLTNRLLMESALSQTPSLEHSHGRADDRVERQFLAYVADAIQKNRETITALWLAFSKAPLTLQEREIAQQFAQLRNDYMTQGITPLLDVMRARDYDGIRAQSIVVERLFAPTHRALQSLTRLQFDISQNTYQAGVDRYDAVLRNALLVLFVLIVVMCWLGWVLNDSIVKPLNRVIAIFKNIARGAYDTPIDIHGRDEISAVLRELQDMQTKLGEDERAIHQLAFYDPLTHLPNRRLLRERLQQALYASARTRIYGAVLMIDLDHFKTINDTQGHAVGDSLLVEVAQRLKDCVRQTDTVARLGGDEFVVMPGGSGQRGTAGGLHGRAHRGKDPSQHSCAIDGRAAGASACRQHGNDFVLR